MRSAMTFFLCVVCIFANRLVNGAEVDACNQPSSSVQKCNIAWGDVCRSVVVNLGVGCMTVNASVVVGDSVLNTDEKPETKLEDSISLKAKSLLVKLDANPIDEAAQNEARNVIVGCRSSKTTKEMYSCSGLFVPPIVRLNCLNNGPCMPLPWNANQFPSGEVQWFAWQTYSDVEDLSVAALSKPWVTTPENAQKCTADALEESGALNESKFSLCMVKKMGGKPAQVAMKCYEKWAMAPAQYSACVTGFLVHEKQVSEVNCVTGSAPAGTDCLRILGLADRDKCSLLGSGTALSNDCLGSFQSGENPTVDCVKTVGGDVTLLGHCLKGVQELRWSPRAQAIGKCADVIISSASSNGSTGATELQRTLLDCSAPTGANKVLVESFGKAQGLIACVNNSNEATAKKVACLESAGVHLPPQAALAACLSDAHTGLDAAACAGIKGVEKLRAAEACLSASHDSATQALCIGAQVGLPKDQARLVSCAASASSYAAGAACMAGPFLGAREAQALKCAAESQGSPGGMAVCMAGPSMNAELRIAAECLASSGGVPITFAACAGGRLSMKELQQCISGGFKSENGCFGENNEIVKYFDAQEKVLRRVMQVLGLENAYNNILSDLKNGKLGDNNEIRKVFDAINKIALLPPDQAAKQLADAASRAGQDLVAGGEKVAEEVRKASEAIAKSIQEALPQVPSNIGGALGLQNGVDVKVSPQEVKVGDVKIDLSNPSISIGDFRCC